MRDKTRCRVCQPNHHKKTNTKERHACKQARPKSIQTCSASKQAFKQTRRATASKNTLNEQASKQACLFSKSKAKSALTKPGKHAHQSKQTCSTKQAQSFLFFLLPKKKRLASKYVHKRHRQDCPFFNRKICQENMPRSLSITPTRVRRFLASPPSYSVS